MAGGGSVRGSTPTGSPTVDLFWVSSRGLTVEGTASLPRRPGRVPAGSPDPTRVWTEGVAAVLREGRVSERRELSVDLDPRSPVRGTVPLGSHTHAPFPSAKSQGHRGRTGSLLRQGWGRDEGPVLLSFLPHSRRLSLTLIWAPPPSPSPLAATGEFQGEAAAAGEEAGVHPRGTGHCSGVGLRPPPPRPLLLSLTPAPRSSSPVPHPPSPDHPRTSSAPSPPSPPGPSLVSGSCAGPRPRPRRRVSSAPGPAGDAPGAASSAGGTGRARPARGDRGRQADRQAGRGGLRRRRRRLRLRLRWLRRRRRRRALARGRRRPCAPCPAPARARGVTQVRAPRPREEREAARVEGRGWEWTDGARALPLVGVLGWSVQGPPSHPEPTTRV